MESALLGRTQPQWSRSHKTWTSVTIRACRWRGSREHLLGDELTPAARALRRGRRPEVRQGLLRPRPAGPPQLVTALHGRAAGCDAGLGGFTRSPVGSLGGPAPSLGEPASRNDVGNPDVIDAHEAGRGRPRAEPRRARRGRRRGAGPASQAARPPGPPGG